MMRLSEFQNGKMGLYNSKIDQDTAKNVKCKILKNNSFRLRKTKFLNKNCYFSKLKFLHFLLYLGQFLSYTGPFYHFGILKASPLSICILMRIITNIENAMK